MKHNKASILAILALGGLMVCGPIASAQDTNTPSAAPATPPGPRPGMVRGRGMQAVLDKLDLAADQKEKVTVALKERGEKLKALGADTSLTPQDRGPKAKEIRDDFQAKLKTILTPEQYTKFEEFSKQGMRGPVPPTAPLAPKTDSSAQK